MNEIRGFINNHFCRSSTDGNIQTKLLSILNDFNDWEKQAVNFLDNRTWYENLDMDLNFRLTMNNLEDKKLLHNKFESKFRSLLENLHRLSEQIKINENKEKENREIIESKQAQ
jgi:hypothetical protein